MVRKTIAVEVSKTTKAKTAPTSDIPQKVDTQKSTDTSDDFDAESLLKSTWNGIQENWMTLLGLVCILIGLIQLRAQILGMILLTTGILLISGFFSKK